MDGKVLADTHGKGKRKMRTRVCDSRWLILGMTELVPPKHAILFGDVLTE